jgi:hypothetical protein
VARDLGWRPHACFKRMAWGRYIAFHNEHDPHQAPKSAIDAFESTIRSDTYKVTAAQIATMDEQSE